MENVIIYSHKLLAILPLGYFLLLDQEYHPLYSSLFSSFCFLFSCLLRQYNLLM